MLMLMPLMLLRNTNAADAAAIEEHTTLANTGDTIFAPNTTVTPLENPTNNPTGNGGHSEGDEQAIHRELLEMTGAEWNPPGESERGIAR